VKILYSTDKHEISIDDDLLYAFVKQNNQINIQLFDLENLSEIDGFDIEVALPFNFRTSIDRDFIYFVDVDSFLVKIDKITGELVDRTPIDALCVAPIQYDDYFVYLLCLLPTRSTKIRFSTYFIQKINKDTGEKQKFAYKEGNPTQSLISHNDCLLFSDILNLNCLKKNGEEKWIAPLRSKMKNKLIAGEDTIVASSSSGAVQVFDIDTGRSKFSVQLPTSLVLPQTTNETLYWITDNILHSIDINKISNRVVPWEDKAQLPTKKITSFALNNGSHLIGNFHGQIAVGQTIYDIDQDAVVSFNFYKNLTICETAQKVFVLDLEKNA